MNGHDATSPDEERGVHADWSPASVLGRLEAVLDPSEFRSLLERMNRSAGDDGDLESAWLERVVTAAATLPLPAVPSELSIRLRTLFPPQPPPRHFAAVLTNDSRFERELVGVRGGADNDGWTLTYDTELGDLLIDLWCNGDSHDVEAQLMSTARHAEFSLTLTGPAEFAQQSDRLGRASIENIPSGVYEVTVGRPDVEITARLEVPSP